MRIILFISILVLLLFSCEKEIKLKIDETKPKLVVNALFNNDSIWKLELSKSKFILDTQRLETVNNAFVYVEDENENKVILTNRGNGIYQAFSETPEIGKKYRLDISHQELEDVSAISSLPPSVEIEKTAWGNNTIVQDMNMKELLVTFKDIPNEENHYLIQVLVDYWEYIFDKETWEIIDSTIAQYPIYVISEDNSLSKGKGEYSEVLTFSDNLFDGELYTFKIGIDEYYSSSEYGIVGLHVSLSRISEEYYWYESSYQKYLQTQGNPFAQPVQVYTNITNGLGVFAGYSTAKSSVPIE